MSEVWVSKFWVWNYPNVKSSGVNCSQVSKVLVSVLPNVKYLVFKSFCVKNLGVKCTQVPKVWISKVWVSNVPRCQNFGCQNTHVTKVWVWVASRSQKFEFQYYLGVKSSGVKYTRCQKCKWCQLYPGVKCAGCQSYRDVKKPGVFPKN